MKSNKTVRAPKVVFLENTHFKKYTSGLNLVRVSVRIEEVGYSLTKDILNLSDASHSAFKEALRKVSKKAIECGSDLVCIFSKQAYGGSNGIKKVRLTGFAYKICG